MKLIVGITGSSGAIYGIKLLEELKGRPIETHLIVTDWGGEVVTSETGYTMQEIKDFSDHWYEQDNMAARISSGTFSTKGMIVAPCSMRTLSGIACGNSDNLLTRAADVTMKEQRKLVLLTRETPLNSIHLKNMLTLSKAGVVIMPPVPSFYVSSTTIEDIVEQTVKRLLSQFNISTPKLKEWTND